MILLAVKLMAVMLLTDPTELIDAEAAAAISEDANRVELVAPTESRKTVIIDSDCCDYDRKSGVLLFEGHAIINYGEDYTMCAHQIYSFVSASNVLRRVVAVGNVVITNATRIGTCHMATYRRSKSEIEMFGDGEKSVARLVEQDEGGGILMGARIRFWLDSEQVEVENSKIEMESNQQKAVQL